MVNERLLPARIEGRQAGLPHSDKRNFPFALNGAKRALAFERHVDAFRRGLNEAGYVEGRNTAIVYHWADGQQARLPELAAALVRSRASLIVATGGSMSAHAATNATATIPIVFFAGPDPVADGLVLLRHKRLRLI